MNAFSKIFDLFDKLHAYCDIWEKLVVPSFIVVNLKDWNTLETILKHVAKSDMYSDACIFCNYAFHDYHILCCRVFIKRTL